MKVKISFYHNCKACLMTLTLHSDALCWDLVGTVIFTKYMITKETIHLQYGIFYFFNVYVSKKNNNSCIRITENRVLSTNTFQQRWVKCSFPVISLARCVMTSFAHA